MFVIVPKKFKSSIESSILYLPFKVIEERMKLLKLSDDVNDAPTQEADKSTTALIKKTIFLDMLCEMHTNDKISFVEVQEQVDTFMFAGIWL